MFFFLLFGNFPDFFFLCFLLRRGKLSVKLNNRKNTMGKNKMKRSRREEQQAKKVLVTMGVVAIVLVVAMFVLYSYWS